MRVARNNLESRIEGADFTVQRFKVRFRGW